MAEGCALVAFPKWERTGVRVSNHSFDLDGQHSPFRSSYAPIDNGHVTAIVQLDPNQDQLLRALDRHPSDVTKSVRGSVFGQLLERFACNAEPSGPKTESVRTRAVW